jgi:multicomponent Na+:H+ antiporter subunit E
MLLATLLLALAWTALQGALSLTNLLTGFVLGYAVLQLLSHGGALPRRYTGKLGTFLGLFAFLMYELVLANIRLAVDMVRTKSTIRPGVIRLPLDVESDGEILLLSALINLTPGSVALDVSEDRRTMYVHVMHLETPDQSRQDIKTGFERRVRNLFN